MVGLWSTGTFAIWHSIRYGYIFVVHGETLLPHVAIPIAVPSIQQQERFKALLKIPPREVVGAVNCDQNIFVTG